VKTVKKGRGAGINWEYFGRKTWETEM